MSTDVAKREILTPAEMIMQAVSGTADLTKVKELLELQFKWEANEARKFYADDFALAQANILPVVKKKDNNQTHSKYADLGSVIETTQPIYTKQGFSITFNEGDSPKENHVRITADVLHRKGHKESYHLDVPMDGKGIQGNANMTAIHGKASSVSYGRRYLMCMIWNIPTADNDGNVGIKYINQWQVEDLRNLLKDRDLSEAKLCEFMKVEKIEEILEKEFKKAEAGIKAAKKVSK